MLERYGQGAFMPQAINRKIRHIKPSETFFPHMEQVLDTMKRGAVFVNKDGIITFMNRSAENILQVDKGEVIGKKVYTLPLRTPVYRVLSEYCRDAQSEITLSGKVYAVLASEVRNPQGAVLGELTEIWDITAEKKEKRQWEEFVAMMTHDLKSPLTVINGYLQMLKIGVYGELGERLNSVVDQMEQSGARLASMVEELLGAYQMELGIINLHRERSDVGAILKECYDDNLNEAREKGIEFTYSVEKGIPPVYLDEKQMARVFDNLISNAIKFTPDGGRVVVSAGVAGGNLHVNIDDTGIGIPRQDLPRIFKKYYRSAGASGFKGTGLGLAISRAIVEAHGGDIDVQSTEGEGSRFIVMIALGEPGSGEKIFSGKG